MKAAAPLTLHTTGCIYQVASHGHKQLQCYQAQVAEECQQQHFSWSHVTEYASESWQKVWPKLVSIH